jgi:hypothetical protein
MNKATSLFNNNIVFSYLYVENYQKQCFVLLALKRVELILKDNRKNLEYKKNNRLP